MSNEWDHRYLAAAEHFAGWSKDPSTKVGAILVGADRRKIAIGYNGFPPGIADTPERLNDRELKYPLTQHAERNVLDNATFDTRGATLAVTFFPCCECTKSIISKGIRRVITRPPSDREPWASHAKLSVMLLEEAGIELVIL